MATYSGIAAVSMGFPLSLVGRKAVHYIQFRVIYRRLFSEQTDDLAAELMIIGRFQRVSIVLITVFCCWFAKLVLYNSFTFLLFA
jgi:hypothetical protein